MRRCAIIGKSAAYFGVTDPPKSARNPPHAGAAHSRQGPAGPLGNRSASGNPRRRGQGRGFLAGRLPCRLGCLAVPVAGLVEPGAVGSWLRLVGSVWSGVLGGGFLADFSGAKTNRRLFRAGAPRPTPRGHKPSSGRPQRAIIGKSAAYFGVRTPPKSARNPPHARAAHSGQGPALHKRATSWRIAVFMLGSMVFHTVEKPSRKVPHSYEKACQEVRFDGHRVGEFFGSRSYSHSCWSRFCSGAW